MLDRETLLQNLEGVRKRLAEKGRGVDWAAVTTLNDRRRALQAEHDGLRHRQTERSKDIPLMKKRGEDAAPLLAEMKVLSDQVTALARQLADIEASFESLIARIPNLPLESVPLGSDAEHNRVEKTWGDIPQFSFVPKSHADLGEALGILDFARAAKIVGARFCLYKGLGARLERALIQFMLDLHTEAHGYTEVLPPFMANRASLFGTGSLPKFAADLFGVSGGELYPTADAPYEWFLIPTAEVPVTNIHRDETLSRAELPVKYVAYTPCFRSEAGSYGKDVRGLIRQHQFNKVELVQFAAPEDSEAALESLTRHAETVLERLKLPYRRVTLCTGDMGFSAAKTHDLEVWLPSENTYREISSCSTFTDFQARRAKIRYVDEAGKKKGFVHTLNGSGLAVGRTVVAILENYQAADGSIKIPEVLVPYMGGVVEIGIKTANL